MEEAKTPFRRKQIENHPLAPGSRSLLEDSGGLASAGSPMSMDDAGLLSLVGKGDQNAMGTLFDRYSRVVYSVALRVLRDPGAAEDVLQEVFMQVWRKPETLVVNRASMGAWLAVVTRNRSIDAIRRQKPSESVEDVSLPSGSDVAGEAERNSLMERVRMLIGGLPQEQRKALEMAFFDGLTHTEIAETTGDPLGTVKTRIRTALLALRKGMHA